MPPRKSRKTSGKTTAISTVTAPREGRAFVCFFIVVTSFKSRDGGRVRLLADQHWDLS